MPHRIILPQMQHLLRWEVPSWLTVPTCPSVPVPCLSVPSSSSYPLLPGKHWPPLFSHRLQNLYGLLSLLPGRLLPPASWGVHPPTEALPALSHPSNTLYILTLPTSLMQTFWSHSGIFCWNPANVPGNPVHISVLYHSAQKTFHAKTEGRPMGLLQNVPPE